VILFSQARLKKKSQFVRWQPRWFRLNFDSLILEYYADAQFSQILGRISLSTSSSHSLQNGVLTLSNVEELSKGGRKSSYILRHNDAKALEWWNETLRLAEQERKLRPQA
jgi:hypothetical protein